jgi:hypothetical protein
MTSIAISRAYNPVEIDLWGTKFETVDLARSASKKAMEIAAEVNQARRELETTDWDKLVAKVGEGLDLRLTRTGNGKTKPSTLLKAKWKADEISLSRIFEFLGEITFAEMTGPDEDEIEDGDRPS